MLRECTKISFRACFFVVCSFFMIILYNEKRNIIIVTAFKRML